MDERKAIIVTGAAGGLGSRTVANLAAAGHRVLAVDLDAEALARASDGVEGEVVDHSADLTGSEQVQGTVARAVEAFGRLDAIFNNAAIEGPLQPIGEYEDDEFDRVMRVNCRTVWLGMKYALPALLDSGGGVILNTASTGGMMGWPGLSGYVASKHAVIGMTRAVALENAGNGIRCNALSPGPMDTRMIWALGETLAPGDRSEQLRQFEGTISGRPPRSARRGRSVRDLAVDGVPPAT